MFFILIPKENTGENLCDKDSLGKEFLDMGPKAQSIKEKKIAELSFIRIKIFCSGKYIIKKMKNQATYCKKIFVNHMSSKVLGSRIYKESQNLEIRK